MNAQVRNFRAKFLANSMRNLARNFARKSDISHPDTLQVAQNSDTLLGFFGQSPKYQIVRGARHSLRVSGAGDGGGDAPRSRA